MRVVIGLGSNLGDRIATLRLAAARVGEIARVLRGSRIYETAPAGGPPQGDYLNAAILVDWRAEPERLLELLLAIERAMGRERRERWAARTLDLDVLWIDGVVVETDQLVVPHPRLLERAFATLPLLDVVPDAVDPRTGCPISTIHDPTLRVLDDALFPPESHP